MTLLLIILLILLLFGGSLGYRNQYWGYGNPVGIVILIVLIIVLFGLFLPSLGYHWYP